MSKTRKIEVPSIAYREATVERMLDEESRTVELSFSSETPVERFFGWEILDHNPNSIDMSRLGTKSAPLLLDHNPTRQIGIVETARIGDDRRGYATVRFSRSAMAQEVFQDVADGIKRLVSVGYRIHDVKLDKSSKEEGDTYRVTRWEPLEISLVSIPADINVGVGRAADDRRTITIETQEEQSIMEEKNTPTPPAPAPAPEPVDRKAVESDVRKAEQTRVTEIEAIGRKFNMLDEAFAAIRDGATVEQFRTKILDKIEANGGHLDTQAANIGMSEREVKRYSLLRAIQAQITGDWKEAGLELEASRSVQQLLNRKPQGIYVPHDILIAPGKVNKREITTATEPELVGTDHLAGSFIDLLRNRTLVMQLGAQTLTGLTGSVEVPKQTGAATGGWVAQGSSQALSDQTFGEINLSPKTASARTAFTRQMLLQSNPSIETLVMNDLIRVIALLIDLGAISGDGLSNKPTGIIETSGVGAVAGASLDWDAVVELETDVAAANAADLGAMAYLTNATVNGLLKTRKKDAGSGMFLAEGGQMNGYPVAVSNQVPSAKMVFGAFNQVLIAMWGGLDILVDPYTAAASGGVQIHAFQSVDVGVRQPAAFSVASSIS